jgi:UDP-N-acetylmuramoylalanine--D-glutamate ligase
VNREALAGQRVVIVGLARQGTALARFFCAQGAHVVVTDVQPASQLQEAMASLEGLPIEYVLGEHPLALLDGCDLLCLSGGVPPETPLPREARCRGIPLSNDSVLTLHLVPAPVIGVTGSSGKTTTTTLVGEMLKASGLTTWVGGNIGMPLIDRAYEIQAGDRVVLELSSFQLQLFAERPPAFALAGALPVPAVPAREAEPGEDSRQQLRDPHVAAVLNVTPNHLDRHPSMAHYTAAKSNILRFQSAYGPHGEDVAVLGVDDPVTGQWWREGRVDIGADAGQPALHFAIAARRVGFSLVQAVPEGAFLRGDRLTWRQQGQEVEICTAAELRLLGRHNVANVLAALAISGAAGAAPESMRQVATTFAGVPHRLELVRELQGVRWYNDSIATTPERAAAALASFDEPLILLAGGRDKYLPWEEMADLTLRRVQHLILFGEAAGLIGAQIEAARERCETSSALRVHCCKLLEQAVDVAARVAQPGDVVLLSPGGTSFDAYRDFEERGEHFCALVRAL